jgi:hypothetical protein
MITIPLTEPDPSAHMQECHEQLSNALSRAMVAALNGELNRVTDEMHNAALWIQCAKGWRVLLLQEKDRQQVRSAAGPVYER